MPAPDQTTSPLLHLAPQDNVCVVIRAVAAGELLEFHGRKFTAAQDLPLGHKIAVAPIAAGAKVFKYGASIGSALSAIAPGAHVHLHNLKSDYLPTYHRDGAASFLQRRESGAGA